MDLINEDLFDVAITFLNKEIDDYLLNNHETNLINIAKNKVFTDYLLERLKNKYQTNILSLL